MEIMMPDKSLLGSYRHLFGLIGYPLGHSFSKPYFNEKFAREGLSDHFYEAFPISQINQFPELLANYPNLRGLNVTIPYKEQVIPFLDSLDAEAAQVGAVNVIRIQKGKWIGYNSDIHGFEQDMEDFLAGHRQEILPSLVLGVGGAARAVFHVLKKWGYPYRTVSRSPEKSDLVFEEVTSELLRNTPLLINATPLGMAPYIHSLPPLPYEALTKTHFLYDLVYNPAETAFMKMGHKMGAKARNGLGMLHGQAQKAWEIWSVTDPG